MADGEYVPPLLDMPKTEKEKRHEKRVKRLRKEERKKAREEKKKELQVVATDFPQAVNHLSEEELARQALIKAGLGNQESGVSRVGEGSKRHRFGYRNGDVGHCLIVPPSVILLGLTMKTSVRVETD